MNYSVKIIVCLAFFSSLGCTEDSTVKEDTENTSNEPVDVEETIIAEYIDLPVLEILTENNQSVISRDEYINADLRFHQANGISNFKEMRIRGRGNSTWNYPKKPYQIKFDEKESVLGMPEDKRWILLANYADKTMLRKETALKLGRESNLDYTPDSRFVDVYLNQEYIGVYLLTQKVEESNNRVAIGDDGFLLEVELPDRITEEDVYFQTPNEYFVIKEPEVNPEDANYLWVKNYINSFETVLLGSDFLDPDNGYKTFIDIDTFVDWYLINEITKNNDANFGSSVFMHIIPGEVLKMGPIWDFDRSMGNISYNGNESPEGFWIKNGVWYTRLFEDPQFVSLIKQRFNEIYENKQLILETITLDSDGLYAPQERNNEKWGTMGVYIPPNAVVFETYEEEVNYLKEWLTIRLDWLHLAFND